MKYGVAYIVALIVFGACDFVWLSSTSAYYRSVLHSLLADNLRPVPAVLFYLVDLFGIVFFCVAPGYSPHNALNGARGAATRGAVFGFVTYGTYDFTNFATLKGWTVTITVLDLTWGTILTAFAATAGYLASRKL